MSDSKEYDQGWNAAIRRAEQAIIDAPIFPRKNHGGPIADAERLHIAETFRKQIAALTRS
jgi:hypothetical protein